MLVTLCSMKRIEIKRVKTIIAFDLRKVCDGENVIALIEKLSWNNSF
jgi:hypothetical protein